MDISLMGAWFHLLKFLFLMIHVLVACFLVSFIFLSPTISPEDVDLPHNMKVIPSTENKVQKLKANNFSS